MWHVLLHALKESAIILAVIFVCYIIIEFVETALSQKLQKTKKWSPVFGSLFGLIPQCGFSVVSTDLYSKKHLSMGTLLAVFIATSDEAIPIILSNPNKVLSILPLLGIKLVVGILIGYTVDLIYNKSKKQVVEHKDLCHHVEVDHIVCCEHNIENKEGNWHKYLLHPLIHSLKIFVYVFVITFSFGLLVHYVGETNINNFLERSKYFAPLIATLIGLIPNCASSVIISNLFITGGISFGTCVAGLIANAGLGLFVLFKQNKNIKQNLSIIGILVATSITVGYITCLIAGF